MTAPFTINCHPTPAEGTKVPLKLHDHEIGQAEVKDGRWVVTVLPAHADKLHKYIAQGGPMDYSVGSVTLDKPKS